MTCTRADIAESICELCAYTKHRSIKLVESTLEIIKKALESGEDVLISGFGKFCVKEKNPLRERNSLSKDEFILGAGRVVTFRCSPGLRKRLNGKG